MKHHNISEQDAECIRCTLQQDEQSLLSDTTALSLVELDRLLLADDGAPQPRIWRAAR